jgi:hypothetical protein
MLIRPSFAAHPVRASAAVNQGLRNPGYGASPPVLARTPLGLARARAVTGRYPESSCRWLIASRNRIVVLGLTWRSSSSAGRPSFNVSHNLERRVRKGMRKFSKRPRTSAVRPLPMIGKDRKQAGTLAGHPKVPGGWARVPEPGSVAPEGAKHTQLIWYCVTFTYEAFHTRKASIASDRHLEGCQRRP